LFLCDLRCVMRIGVLLDIQSLPTEGGGFTFEQQVFQALMELAAQSQHEFVVFTLGREIPRAIAQKTAIPFVALGREQWQPGVVLAGLRTVLRRRFKQRALQRKRGLLMQLRHAVNQKVLESHGIDCVWSLKPMTIAVDTPYVITIWDLEHCTQPFFPELSFGDEWEQREDLSLAFRRATYVLTGTSVGKQQIEKLYQRFADRVQVLPLPTPQFALDNRATVTQAKLDRHGLTQNQYLFYPAQFWPHKNHANLLYALKRLNQQHNLKIPVAFVGSDKGNHAYVKALAAELGLADQVHFLGFVSQEELVTLYQGALALAFMSLAGPDNLPPLEAFALGCPVIAAHVSGAQEQLGDAALIVDGRDDEQIANAIKSLCDDRALAAQLVQKGYARAAQWTSRDYVGAVLNLFDQFQPIRRCWK
jgi:glycosyltransferase involved in cell wall biosynthesis